MLEPFLPSKKLFTFHRVSPEKLSEDCAETLWNGSLGRCHDMGSCFEAQLNA